MDNLSSLSIVVTLHDTHGRLENLKSWILHELMEKAQVILVHDGEISQEFKQLLPSLSSKGFEFSFGHFGCPGRARNQGLSLARREWITFWDFDDHPNIENFSNLLDRTIAEHSDIGIGSFNVIDRNNKNVCYQQYLASGDFRKSFLKVCVNPGMWRFVFRKDLIQSGIFCDLRRGEDLIFIAENQVLDQRLTLSEEIVYTYVRGDSRQITNSRADDSDMLRASKILFNLRKVGGAKTSLFSSYASISCIVGFISRVIRHKGNPVRNSVMQAIRLLIINCMFNPVCTVRLISYRVRARNSKNRINKKIHLFLAGGLGNQLFQISFLRSMPQVNSIMIYGALPEIKEYLDHYSKHSSSDEVSYRIDFIDKPIKKRLELGRNALLRLSSVRRVSLLRTCIMYLIKKLAFGERHSATQLVVPNGVGFDSQLAISSFASNYVIVGYFQSWKWAKEIKDSVRDFVDNYRRSDHQRELLTRIENGLVMQIRRRDYTNKSNSNIGLLDEYYFAEAVKRFIPIDGKEIFVATDDPTIMTEFSSLFEELSSVKLLDHEQARWSTLREIAGAEGRILSNSTFAWWGAFISDFPAQTVVPNPWFRRYDEPCDLIPNSWERVDTWAES